MLRAHHQCTDLKEYITLVTTITMHQSRKVHKIGINDTIVDTLLASYLFFS